MTAGEPTARRAGDTESARRAVVAVWRIEAARIVAGLARMVGDFGFAEDLAQEALAAALESWPASGVPANPGAWLTSVAKRRAIDTWRRRERHDERLRLIAADLAASSETDDEPPDPDRIDDDMLRLVFIACHPVLPRDAQVALTLRVVGGLTTEEIARAFLVPVATVQQRIVRAKRRLAAAEIAFESPSREEFDARLTGVLGVLYLIFNEGHTATAGSEWMRTDLGIEAIRLARVLVALLPRRAEAHGLLALMELTASRFPARVDAEGNPVLLDDQDRRLWDAGRIRRGRAALAQADALGGSRGPYSLQAAIAETHAVAASVDETDWRKIVRLYEDLARVAPSPVVDLNRAVAVSMADGPDAALDIVDALAADDRLAGYNLLHGVRAELLTRLGRTEEARAEFEAAARLTGNERQRAFLLARAATGRP